MDASSLTGSAAWYDYNIPTNEQTVLLPGVYRFLIEFNAGDGSNYIDFSQNSTITKTDQYFTLYDAGYTDSLGSDSPIHYTYSANPGYSGYSGWSGQSGWSGWSGLSGQSGHSGWSGQQGTSGWSGWSGAVPQALGTGASPTFAGLTINGVVGANGNVYFANTTSNFVVWYAGGVAGPTLTTRSSGTKLVLYPNVAATYLDFALGIESDHMWFSVPQSSQGFKFYCGGASISLVAEISGVGQLSLPTANGANTSGLDLGGGAGSYYGNLYAYGVGTLKTDSTLYVAGYVANIVTVGSNTQRFTHSAEVYTTSTSYTLMKTIQVNCFLGHYRVAYQLKTAAYPYTTSAQTYLNGVAIGAVHSTSGASYGDYYDDFRHLQPGDQIQVYMKSDGGTAYIRSMFIGFEITVPTALSVSS